MTQILVLTLDNDGQPKLYKEDEERVGAVLGDRVVVAQRFKDQGSKTLQEGISEVEWIDRKHQITEAAIMRKMIAGREEVQDLLSNPREESTVLNPEGAAQLKAAALLDFGPNGLRDWAVLLSGDPFPVSLDLARMRNLGWEMSTEEAIISWVVWPDKLELKPAAAVSKWIPFSQLAKDREVTTSQEKLRSFPLDEFMFRAKISKTEEGYEMIVQWLFEPGKVERWDGLETSWIEAGVLARRPLTFLGTEDEFSRKYEIDFLPFILKRKKAEVSDLGLRLGIHYVAAEMEGGGCRAEEVGSATWAHGVGHRFVFARPWFKAVFPWEGQDEVKSRMQGLECIGSGSQHLPKNAMEGDPPPPPPGREGERKQSCRV